MMKELKARVRQNDSQALLIDEGTEMRATQHYDLCWLWNVWGLDTTFDYPIEMLRYSLPWVRVAIAFDDNIGLANRLLVLGIYLALFNRNWHCETAKLSDWPEFAQHIKKLAGSNCQFVDFSGQQRPLGTKRSRTRQLKAEIDFGAWQIGALVFTRGQEVA